VAEAVVVGFMEAAEAVASTVAGVVVSTVVAERVSIARVVAAIAEAAHSGVRGLSAEVATAVAALVAEQAATTERAGVRTADLAHRVA